MAKNIGKIVNYEPSMAKDAADMFNTFNELWPGGFGGGVPYTEDSVHEWLDKTSSHADLIAIDENGELSGYCGLYPHWRDKNAAYINILGVTPKALGRKFGKRMLLKALEIAKEKGLTRVDLNTWSGNMEAVPLYKKIGLFWVPDTQVYMQDFIPGLLQEPIAKDYFTKHPDWYGNFKRELAQAQDRNIVDGMQLYTYKFESEDDYLIADVDRFGWNFCGFERVLDGKKIQVKARVGSHDIFIGTPNTFTIQLFNEYADETTVKLDVKGFKGLQWIEDFPKTVQLKKGDAMSISREFVVDKTTKVFKDNDELNETISASIHFDKFSFNLSASGKIQSTVALRNIREAQFRSIPIGTEYQLPLDIKNNTENDLSGEVRVTIDELPDFTQVIPYKMKGLEISGIHVPIKLPMDRKTNKFTLKATAVIVTNESQTEMPEYTLPLFAKVAGLLELAVLEKEKRLYLMTDKLTLDVNLEGGFARVYRQESSGNVPIRLATGPLYGISLDRTLLYSYELVKSDKYYTLIITANSIQIPGLEIIRYFKVTSGMDEIEYWADYKNINKDKSIYASARTTVASGGISINPYSTKGRAFTPINDKIIESDCITNFMTDPLIPFDPSIWSETWTAVEGLMLRDLSAFFWKPDNIAKVKIRAGGLQQLESINKEIQPGEVTNVAHLWYSFGYNTMAEVRNRWNQLLGNKIIDPMDETLGPKTTPVLDIVVTEKLLTVGETTKLHAEVQFVSPYPLPGDLTLNLPKGWKGGFITEEGIKDKIPMPVAGYFNNVAISLEITVPESETSPIGNIQLHFSGEFELNFDNYISLSAIGEVIITEEELEGEEIYSVSNGKLKFVIPKKFAGGLLRLEDEKGNSYLLDQFPKIQPKFFFEKYLGGAQPFVFHGSSNNLQPEVGKTKSKIVEEGKWKGISSSVIIQEDKEYLRGLELEMTFLTLPGSELIRSRLTLNNNSPREFQWMGSVFSDLGFNGSKDGLVIEATGAKKLWERNQVKDQFLSLGSFDEPYSRIKKGKQSISYIVPESTRGTAMILDFVIMVVGWLVSLQYAKPNSKSSVEFVIALNQPRENLLGIRKALG
ncbi:MAG: GNAT family N-acetyltransferase [Candidatus Heimdallarchaeota archaeon]